MIRRSAGAGDGHVPDAGRDRAAGDRTTTARTPDRPSRHIAASGQRPAASPGAGRRRTIGPDHVGQAPGGRAAPRPPRPRTRSDAIAETSSAATDTASSDATDRPRLLITGANGRFGRCATTLLSESHELVLTDVQAGAFEGHPIHALDITDFEATRDFMQTHRVDRVAHLAIGRAPDRQRPDWRSDETMMRVNLIGTEHVFEAARLAGVQRIVYASSLTVYLGQPGVRAIDRDTPLAPRGLYACTKLFGEQLAEMYVREHDQSIVCLRFGQPYPMRPSGQPQNLRDSYKRLVAITWEDIAESLRCALNAPDVNLAVANIVSSTDAGEVDPLDARWLGYVPQWHFTADGWTPRAQATSEHGVE